MASTTASWEVVGKGKKTKSQIPQMTKTDKKKFLENMPRIEAQPPLKESTTMYQAFIEKELKANGVSSGKASPKENSAKPVDSNKKPGQPKKKKAEQQDKKKKAVTLEEAMKTITQDEVSSLLTMTQARFPDNIDVWLKDLASFLNVKLEEVPETTDPVFSDKAKDYPVSKLNVNCQEMIRCTISEAPIDTLEHMFYHCIQSMLTESSKDHSTYGYRIFLQLLVQVKPSVAMSKLQQYEELVSTNTNNPRKCLSILWALGQTARDFKCGLRVWFKVMLPSLSSKALAPFCIDYLENLFKRHTDMKRVYGEVSVREYFHMMDAVFEDHHVSNELKKKLQAVYPKMKMVAFGGSSPPALRNVFPSYLTRLTPKCSEAMKTEIFSCLINCLVNDKQCYSVWCQMYENKMLSSSILLEYLHRNWDKVRSKVDKKLLQQTLRSFSITNDELSAKGKNSIEGYAQCSAACKALLHEMEQTRFPWFWVIFLLFSTVSAIVAYDLYSSPTVKESRTMRFMENYGISGFAEQVWVRLTTYYAIAYGWLSVNVPLYYSKVEAVVRPQVTRFVEVVVDSWTKTVEITGPYREWIVIKLTDGWHWVYSLSPEVFDKIGHYLLLSWNYCRHYVILIYGHVANLVFIAFKWLEENLILNKFTPESFQQMYKTAISSIQKMTTSFIQWCGHMARST